MKILFLDFDGVINTLESDYEIDPTKIPYIQRILTEYPDMNIVISSTWRYEGLERCRMHLKPIPDERIIDVTPYIRDGSRGQEILQWMSENNIEKKDILIIDDEDAGWFSEGGLRDRLVKTCQFEGIQHKDVMKAFTLFPLAS